MTSLQQSGGTSVWECTGKAHPREGIPVEQLRMLQFDRSEAVNPAAEFEPLASLEPALSLKGVIYIACHP